MEIIFIAGLTILASLIGTISGFGTSTVMIPILSLFMPIQTVIFLVAIIHWFGDIWKIVLFRKGANTKLLIFFGGFGILASFLGASLVLNIPDKVLMTALGVFLLLYVIFITLKPKFKLPENFLTASSGGLLSGFFAGIFGIGGAIRGMFLSAFNLEKNVYLFTSGAIAFLIDSTRLTTYFFQGLHLETNLLAGLILFIPASFLGAFLAKKTLNKIPQKKFRLVIALALLLVVIKLIFF